MELWAAAAEREAGVIAEMQEPEVALKSMIESRDVVEDYSHTGLTLREHPAAFLRRDLEPKYIVPCAEAGRKRRQLRRRLCCLDDNLFLETCKPVGIGRVLGHVPVVVRCAVVPPGGAALAERDLRLIDQMPGRFDGLRVSLCLAHGTSC